MTNKSPWILEVAEAPEPQAREAIAQQLFAYNERLLGPTGIRPLAVLLRSPDRSRIVGGLWGRTSFRWLFVELLFVPDDLRDRRLGTSLLRLAEAEACKRGCLGAWLETLRSRARRFYEKRGYAVFGEIDDYPSGNQRSFLLKRFDGDGTR